MFDWNCLVGRTIIDVDTNFGSNVIKITLEDVGGTSPEFVVIDTEAIGYGLYRPSLHRLSDYVNS